MADKDEKDKYKSFFIWLGKMVGISITQWYLWDETNKISVLFQKFENYSKPKQNITVERYKFNTRVQSNTESIDQYVTEIRLIAKKLPFKHSRTNWFETALCVGAIQRKGRLLREDKLTLEKAISICRANEESKKQMKCMSEESSVHSVKYSQGQQRKPQHQPI